MHWVPENSMLKAHVKINVIVHLENEGDSNDKATLESKYDLAAHHAGVVLVENREEGERVAAMIGNHVNSMFRALSVRPLPPGDHIPDLAAAMGGSPEPKKDV